MASTDRRALALALLLSVALTACGRADTRITADDGRGIERPGGGIWIPETRGADVDDEPAAELDDEDHVDDVGDLAGGEPEGGATSVPARRDAPSDEPEVLELPAAHRPSDDAGTPTTAPSTDAPAERRTPRPHDEPTGTPPEQETPQAEDDEPAQPEVVGDCGATASDRPGRAELEEEVDRLRGLIAERWPDTQAGAWILAEGDRLTVHVGFTRSVRSSLRVLCEEFGHPQLLHGVRTELSELALGEHLEVLLAERDALREGAPADDLPRVIRASRGRYAAVVDHAANGLLVTVEEPSDRLRDAFRERYTPRLQLTEGRFDEDGELVVDEHE